MTLSEELQWRGFVNQTTLRDITDLDKSARTFYLGMDPSADSLTIGNLAAAMMARHFINYGYKAVLLVGGATGMIGDPDGKNEERELKPLEEIARNKAAIAKEYSRIFDGQEFTLVDNYEWFKDLGYLEFLRDIGKHFSMTQLLDRDFVQSRIGEGGSGISYAEFSYSLIQGYDFLHLFRTHGVTLQLCGSDQWGNSISGVDLIRKLEGQEAHIWSTPLVINKTTGKKFGKSEDGAVWLNPAKTSVYEFYQFWLNADDAGVIDYIKIYTLLPKEEVIRLAEATQTDPRARLAQKTLAREVTKLVHGEERAAQVEQVTAALFGGSVSELNETELELLSKEIPTANLGANICDALVDSGAVASNSEARRMLQSGAISLNGEKITEDRPVNHVALLKKGKNTFILIK